MPTQARWLRKAAGPSDRFRGTLTTRHTRRLHTPYRGIISNVEKSDSFPQCDYSGVQSLGTTVGEGEEGSWNKTAEHERTVGGEAFGLSSGLVVPG